MSKKDLKKATGIPMPGKIPSSSGTKAKSPKMPKMLTTTSMISVQKSLDDKIKAMQKASAHLQEEPKEPYTEDVSLIEAVKRDPKDKLKEKIGLLKEMAAFLKAVVDGNDIEKSKVKKFGEGFMAGAFGSDAQATTPPPAASSSTSSSSSSSSDSSGSGGETINSKIGNPFGKSKKKK